MDVALLGTGTMGAPMGRRLLAAGHGLRAWNRTRSRAEPLAAGGAALFDTPAEAVVGADVVVTMLADAPAVEGITDGLDFGSAVWAQMSTVGVAATERLAARGGDVFVDAPVLGSDSVAESGQLTVLASGAARARCAPVFDAVGSRTLDLGDAPGAGTRMKLVLNHWVVTLVESVAETVALAEGLGLDPQMFLDVIDGGPMGPPYAALKGKMMIEREYPPSFSLRLARKDAGLIVEAAAAAGLDQPLAALVHERMGRAIDAGHGEDDFASTVEASRRD